MRSISALFLLLSLIACCKSQESSTERRPETTTVSLSSVAPASIEILDIYVPIGTSNSVFLIWGNRIDECLNLTYGVHYGLNENELQAPRLKTTNVSTVIEDLDNCTKYLFAVSVENNNYQINPNNIRSIVTQIDRLSAPQNLLVDFEPAEEPCLLIKWSASCVNIGPPLGYVISAFEKPSSRYLLITLPPTTQSSFVYPLKVDYKTKFQIKVSTDVTGATASETVTYKVPDFLQPYKVKVSSNPDGAFLIYWSEPYVPYFVERIYYQVNVYRGAGISENYDKYYVTRPVMIYKGNETVYTFIVGSVSYSGEFRSIFTTPIVANILGETRVIEDDQDGDVTATSAATANR